MLPFEQLSYCSSPISQAPDDGRGLPASGARSNRRRKFLVGKALFVPSLEQRLARKPPKFAFAKNRLAGKPPKLVFVKTALPASRRNSFPSKRPCRQGSLVPILLLPPSRQASAVSALLELACDKAGCSIGRAFLPARLLVPVSYGLMKRPSDGCERRAVHFCTDDA
jgi:hypothetical protein